jgi:large subunit ribosomal protein L30
MEAKEKTLIKEVMLAVIRVRGPAKLAASLNDTMKIMRLYKANNCVVVKSTPVYLGMIKKVKDFVTWGEINFDTLKLLLEKKGRVVGNKPLTNDYLLKKIKMNFEEFANELMVGKNGLKDAPGLKTFFRLDPPKKGFERGGIKKPFSMGGALGYRKEHINELLRRMV